MSKSLKSKKGSLIKLTRKYASNDAECRKFFFDMKWPTGFYCEKCGHTHYYFIKRNKVYKCSSCAYEHSLLANTIFQDNKLDLYTLIFAMFLFFSSNKGVSAIELASSLDVNYKTALLLCRKCRILMAQSGSEKVLDSLFYEADAAYIGAKSKQRGRQGCATEQQPFLFILSTNRENEYPRFIKLQVINSETSKNIERFVSKYIVLGKERKLNTDGKFSYDCLKDRIQVNNQKVNYEETEHRLLWLNTVIGNVKNNILGIYHGVTKRDLPLFLKEQEWRFNHRCSGDTILEKIQKYILKSSPMPRKSIVTVLNLSVPYFTCI